MSKSQNDNDEEVGLMVWESDEANEDSDDQKEDMKKYMKTLCKTTMYFMCLSTEQLFQIHKN